MSVITRTAEQEVERLRGVLALIVAAPDHAHGYATAALGAEVRLVPPEPPGAVDALRRIVDEAASGRIITLHGAVQIAQASLNDAGGSRP